MLSPEFSQFPKRTHKKEIVTSVSSGMREDLAQKKPEAHWLALLLDHVIRNPGKVKNFEDKS